MGEVGRSDKQQQKWEEEGISFHGDNRPCLNQKTDYTDR